MGFSKKEKETTQEIRVAKSAFAGLLVKRIGAILGFTVVSIFVLYLCFASTLMRVVPTTSGAGFVPVKGNTFAGGVIPEGTKILVNTSEEVKDGHLDKIAQAFTPAKDAAIISIEAGPNGEVKWMESGLLTVKGEVTKAPFSDDPGKNFLESEYVGVCVKGACSEGEGVIISKKNIYGIVIDDSVNEVIQ